MINLQISHMVRSVSVILDINPLNRFGLQPTWLVLLQIKLRITILLIMKMRYEGTLVSL